MLKTEILENRTKLTKKATKLPLTRGRNPFGWKFLSALAAGTIGLTGVGVAAAGDGNKDLKPPTTLTNTQTLTGSFQTSDKALDSFLSEKNLNLTDPCKDYTKIADDMYGPEMDRACLEQNPLEIKATDYVKDNDGNVIKQRAVINMNELWESAEDPVTHRFSDFRMVAKIPLENVLSMVSSSDGNVEIDGGEDVYRSANTSLRISYDTGKNWENINWPYQISGPVKDLFRLTDSNFVGVTGNYEGGVGLFTINVDQNTKTASIQAVTPNIGSAYSLRVASVDPINTRVEMVSVRSFYLQDGIERMDFDYITGNGTVDYITQTLVSGVPTYLGYLYGNGLYRDELGHLHVKSSDPFNQFLYDIDTTAKPSTATRVYYGDAFNNMGIPNYMPDSLAIFAVDVFTNTLGSRETKVAGGYASMLNGTGRAAFADLDNNIFYDLEPSISSGLDQRGMQRLKINNQLGYGLNILPLGQAFIPDGGSSVNTKVYTNRGLGKKYMVFIPLAYKP